MSYEEYKRRVIAGERFEDRDILKLADEAGWTIAHWQAWHGWIPQNKFILELADKRGIITVAKVVKHYQMDLLISFKKYAQRVRGGERFEDLAILKLADKFGLTIAHWQCAHGWTTEDTNILQLADAWGVTVAHRQAKRGWTTEDPEILKLTDDDGETVAQTMEQYRMEHR